MIQTLQPALDLDLLAAAGAESFRRAEVKGGFHLIAKGSGLHFVDDLHDLLSHATLFAGLSLPEAQLLGSIMRIYDSPAHQTLIHEGDQGDFMLLLMSGRMEVVRTDEHGFANRIALAHPGQTLGEMSMLDGMPRFASCRTLSPCRVGVLGRKAMLTLLQRETALGNKILLRLTSMLAERLRSTSARLVDCMEAGRL